MYTEREEQYYCNMNEKKLRKLDDKKLIRAIFVREDSRGAQFIRSGRENDTEKAPLSDPRKVVSVAIKFYLFVINHPNLSVDEIGLRFYFGGYTRDEYVPYTSKALEAIGALEYKTVFDDFVRKNRVNVKNLYPFAKTIDLSYNSQAKTYDFTDTDEKLRSLTGIENYLAQYIRKNMKCFIHNSEEDASNVLSELMRKTQAKSLLKKILAALHEQRFDKVSALVTYSTLDAEEIRKYVQGTVEGSGYRTIDKYIAENVDELELYEGVTVVGYCLTADGNEPLPMYLSLEIEKDGDGKTVSYLNIDAD